VDKYFGTVDGRKWTLVDRHGGKITKALKGYSKHKVETGSYARVGYDRSYFDGDTAYWAGQLSKGYGNITPSKAKMLKKQNGICPLCKYRLTNDDLGEVHHIKPRSKKGEDKYSNLILVHRHCHDKWHRENPGNKRGNRSKGVKVEQLSPEHEGFLKNWNA
jgi:RNA-directed DNA polymerase